MEVIYWIITILLGLCSLANASLFGLCLRDRDYGEAALRGIFAVLWLVLFALYLTKYLV